MAPQDKPLARIAPNTSVFDRPVIGAIEEGLFADAGLAAHVKGRSARRS
jgi:hypothetical protein